MVIKTMFYISLILSVAHSETDYKKNNFAEFIENLGEEKH